MSSKYIDDEDDINEGKTNDSEGSKTKDDDEPPPLEEVTTIDPFKPTPPNLVQRFVEFAFSMLHTKMDSFFERHAEKFDQEYVIDTNIFKHTYDAYI